MAFEDLAMSPEDWHSTGVPGNNAMNDGDFNDFVFYVSGISCSGGGQACDTGLQGACSVGRTDCATDGMTGTCRPIITAGAELCDNVDNDCNGKVDDGDGLCPTDQVCDKGSCVGACGTGEFRCEVASAASPAIASKTRAPTRCATPVRACRNGVCMNACDGVTCPGGQECQLGRCIDPCKAVTCTGGKVCERGLCVSDCACRGCADGLECGKDGKCSDPQCANVMCAMGQRCEAGACVDNCAGVMCPGGGACVNGACQMAVGGSSSTGGGNDVDVNLPGGITLGGSSAVGTGTGASSTGANKATGSRLSQAPGCACEVVGQSPAGEAALLLGGLGAALGLARRRRRAA